MSDKETYMIPAQTLRIEQEIKRSRFIAPLGHAEDAEQAQAFIERVRESYRDASHNTWAYMAGPPGNTLAIGMSDDGEPRGTAGRPMLNVLQQNEIGEIVAVVTRFFGGTKLGARGLTRAYSGSVSMALDRLPLTVRMVLVAVSILIPYQQENPVRHLLSGMGLEIEKAAYRDKVALHVSVPSQQMEELKKCVRDVTSGTGAVTTG